MKMRALILKGSSVGLGIGADVSQAEQALQGCISAVRQYLIGQLAF
jgi:hypothetical protein